MSVITNIHGPRFFCYHSITFLISYLPMSQNWQLFLKVARCQYSIVLSLPVFMLYPFHLFYNADVNTMLIAQLGIFRNSAFQYQTYVPLHTAQLLEHRISTSHTL